MGDPARADPALIPDFGVMSDPTWNWRGERLAVEGNYMLVVENLMDLTHLPSLHLSTLANTAIPENDIPVEYKVEGQRISVDRWVLDTPVPPYFRLLAKFGKQDRIDRGMNTIFTPPAFVRIDLAPGAPRLDLVADRAGIQARRMIELMIRDERVSVAAE